MIKVLAQKLTQEQFSHREFLLKRMASSMAERQALLFTFLLTFILAACSSSRQLEPVELEDFEEEASFKTLWSTKVSGGQGDYFHQFRLQQDAIHIYAASYKGRVFKISKETGKKIHTNDSHT